LKQHYLAPRYDLNKPNAYYRQLADFFSLLANRALLYTSIDCLAHIPAEPLKKLIAKQYISYFAGLI
jgi:hypothetical protein